MWWADFRVKCSRFIRRYSKIIMIGMFLWAILLVVNNLLKGYEPSNLTVSYNPHDSVLNSSDKVSTSLKSRIDECIDKYFKYCQNREYESAYDILTDDCKSECFNNDIENFKMYIDMIFDEEKAYYIQNYSNYDSIYVYQMRIFENIMKTGLTGKNEIYFYDDKISFQEVKGEIKLGVRQFIAHKRVNEVYEDDYMKIWIESKNIYYEQEEFEVRIKNKSKFIIVLEDEFENNEVLLSVGSSNRPLLNTNVNMVLFPNEERTFKLRFQKFYDEKYLSAGLIFDAVRILKTYSMTAEMHEYELENAEKLYSIQLPF